MSTSQKTRVKQAKAITLKGSTEIVTDFFKFAVNAYVWGGRNRLSVFGSFELPNR